MKAIALASLLALIANTAAQAAPASSPPAKVRTIKVKVNPRTINNLPNFPLSTLKTSLSPKLYKSLSVSDLTAWIVVHVPPYGGEPKNIHSVPRSFQKTGAASAASAKSGHGSGISHSSLP